MILVKVAAIVVGETLNDFLVFQIKINNLRKNEDITPAPLFRFTIIGIQGFILQKNRMLTFSGQCRLY